MKKRIKFFSLLAIGIVFLFGYSSKTEAVRSEHRGVGLHNVCQRAIENCNRVDGVRVDCRRDVPKEEVLAEREARRENNQNYCVQHNVENCVQHQEQPNTYCQNREQGQHHNQQRGQGHGRRHGWSN